jgi:hypothetical protein
MVCTKSEFIQVQRRTRRGLVLDEGLKSFNKSDYVRRSKSIRHLDFRSSGGKKHVQDF